MYPVDLLLKDDRDIDLFWYNPNIHPQFEWDRRLENLGKVAEHYGVKLITVGDACEEEYWKSEEYLSEYPTRCDMCYDRRMDVVAKLVAIKKHHRLKHLAVRWLGGKGRKQLRPWYFFGLAFLMWAPLNGVGIPLDNFVLGLRMDHLLHFLRPIYPN